MVKLIIVIATLITHILSFSQPEKIDSLKNVLINSTDTTRVNLLVELGLMLYNSSPDQAEKVALEAIDYAKKNNYQKGLAKSYRILGYSYHVRANYLLANEAFKSALTIAIRLHDNELIAAILNALGMNYFEQGDYRAALENFIRALELAEEFNYEKQITTVLNNIGMVYHKQGELNVAIKYYNGVMTRAEKSNDTKNIANTLNNLGIIYKEKKIYDSAIQFHNNALELRLKLNDQRGASSSYINLSFIYKHLGDYKKSLEYLEKNVAIKRKLADVKGIVNYHVSAADVYTHLKDFERAKKEIDQAYQLAQSIPSKEILKNIYDCYSEHYEATGDFAASLYWKNKWVAIKDSLFNLSKSKQLDELQALYELSKKENEIMTLERERVMAEQTKLVTNSIFLILILLGVLFIFLMIQKLKQRKKYFKTQQALIRAELINAQLAEQELRKELDFKNKELASYTVNFIQKSKLMEDMKNGLELLGKSKGEDLDRKIQSMNRIIDNNFQIDREWEDFRIQFEQIHIGFFEYIKKHCPDATSSDLKLCALIKLNMNAKESAKVLGISPESVKTARYRLRRKLNLAKDQTLTDFVMGVSSSVKKREVTLVDQVKDVVEI